MDYLSVTDAICTRESTRAFSKQPVSKKLLQEILIAAGQSASSGNLQPWQVHALAGEVKDRLVNTVLEHCQTNPRGEHPDVPIYPEHLAAPWSKRRADCGQLLYEALGITRQDQQARKQQLLKNFSFFDAPVGLIITMNRNLCQSQMLDIGIFMQSLLLLAQERGLGTCAQSSWTLWPNTIRKVLNIDDNEMVIAGVSIGYPDENKPVNSINQPRVAPDQFISMHGF